MNESRRPGDELSPETYAELRAVAQRFMGRERTGHTLQPTALVHEAWLKLVQQDDVVWNDRAHFFRVAARAMRSILVDHARKRDADKRGAGAARVTLEGAEIETGPRGIELLDLDRALERLESEHPEAAAAVELHYFAGLSHAEVAEATGVSESTAFRNLRFAKAWLRIAMADDR